MSIDSGAPRVVVLLALVGAFGCSSASPLQVDRKVLELPAGADVWWVTVNPGGDEAAYAERRGSDAYLVAGGRRLGPYT